MKKLCFVLVVALALFGLACSRKETPLTILTEDYPPLSFMENDMVTGYGAEVVGAIQEILKTNFVPQLLEWDDAYERALNEPNVVLFTMEKTPERADKFHFIGPLGAHTASFYALAESDLQLPNLEAAKEVKIIATTKKWFTEQYLLEQGFTNLVSTDTPQQNITMLLEKKADLSVFTNVTYPLLAKSAGIDPDALKPIFDVMSTEYYITISKATDPAVVAKWQEAFAQLQQDGSLQKIKDKWFPPAE
ncbi:MAG: transporter substrate-binding domain-containing protein [Candidatus Syntrophosphaera sp.]|nr:transporter substrate-binding domain-containing protein [Candidatus Syntrophosphaera sp.]